MTLCLSAVYKHYVGYLGDAAVTSSTLLLAGGISGIYDVSTVPSVRRMGLGVAITLAGLRAAQERGYRYAVLQASEEGHALYEKLGFAELYHEVNYRWQRAIPQP